MNPFASVSVKLRAHEDIDKAAFIAAMREPEFYRLLGCEFPSGVSREAEAEVWYARKTEPKYSWAIEADCRCVGSVWLHSLETANRRARFAIEIFDSRYWNRGVGKIATAAVVKFAFDELNLHRVDLRVLTENVRAIRCYERCGFVREGVQRDTLFLDGKWYSDLWMSVLKSEWPTERSTLGTKLKGHPNTSEINDSPAYPDLAGAPSAWQARGRQPNMKLAWREASSADLGLLAEWNHQLIRDEGHRNSMTVEQLAERMKDWLQGEYRAVIFSDDQPVGYALFKGEEGLVYLRQFLVRPERRRGGIGRAALEILRKEIWPTGIRLTVDVLCQNTGGVAFWRSVGYQDYCLTLEIMPR